MMAVLKTVYNVMVYTWDEFRAVVKEASNDFFDIEFTGTEWFYSAKDEHDMEDDKVSVMVGKYINSEVKDIIIDTQTMKVAVVF